MSKISFNLSPEFFAELLTGCEAERKRINQAMGKHRAYVGGYIGQGYLMPTEIYTVMSIPTGDRIKQLVETAFWATLEREEGQAVVFNVVYGVKFGENGA